jgi:LuxR family maltose regulon positive regulatory protein
MPQPSGDSPILATKLFVPSSREKLVPRARLRDRLSATRGGRVTLIAAAAGWGKSTLLADWAIAAPGRVAWLSLDATDDEPRRFLNYVIASMRAAECIGADDLIDVMSSRPDAIQATVTELLNAIAIRGGPVALVLDDYHVIHARAVHEILQFIIDHLPPNLQLVIATRADPPLALSRLRARGLLLELRGDDLRFTPEEAHAFLNGAMGLALDPAESLELEQRTEGWAVGLQMAAISLSGRGETRAFIQRFSGSNRYVLDYLTDEVLDRQTPLVREFLLTTSILTRLTSSLCDAVMMRTDSAAILEQLDAANLFLIPLDEVRHWYRYHHLFATLLQHQLTRMHSADEIAELHKRAARWYASNGMPESAIEHALAANDVDFAIAVVSQHASPRMLSGDIAAVVSWFDRLPRERVDHDINLLIAKGMALLGDWQLPRAYECTVRATELIDESTPPPRQGAVYALHGALCRALGKHEEGLQLLERARPLVDENTFAYGLVHYFLGLTAMMEADAGAASRVFASVRARHTRIEDMMTAVLGQTFTGLAEWWRGNPEETIALANEMFGWIDISETFVEGRPLDCFPRSLLALVHCAWNELPAAREHAERAVERARRGIMVGLFESGRTLSRVALSAGDFETAMRAAGDAQRAVRNTGSNEMWTLEAATLTQNIHFRRWQATGNRADLNAVESWLRSENIVARLKDWITRRVAGFHCDAPLLLASRVLIEHEKYDDADAILDFVLPDTIRTERLIAQMETQIIRAILEARRGRLDPARTAIQHALDLAAKPRYTRFFLDEGPLITPLLERASGDFAQQILSAFGTTPRLPRSTAPDALSDRELEVLQLIASGASNSEAGRKLFIAASTVKKHLENIYAKLGVGGRVEAIARAKEMGWF